ncbi:MAG: shikimate kinase, partial [Spirochaetota bacterium]
MNVKRIYLMGMKHTGKSVHGRALAERLGARFCDIDTLVQELDSTETGMRRPVRDIYREDGAERFLRDRIVPGQANDEARLSLLQFVTETRGPQAAMEEAEAFVQEGTNDDLFRSLRASLLYDEGRRDE